MVPMDPETSSGPPIPPNLARVIDVWKRLPKSTKKRIMTIFECANKRLEVNVVYVSHFIHCARPSND